MPNQTISELTLTFDVCSRPKYWQIFITGYFIVAVLGIVGNSAIIAATFRPKSALCSKANFLIATLACLDLCTNVSPFVIYWSESAFCVLQKQCAFFMGPMIFSLNSGAALILVIGIDRTLAIALATDTHRYRHWSRKRYVMIACIFPAIYGLTNVTLLGEVLVQNDDKIVEICIPPTLYGPTGLQYFLTTNMLCCLLVVLIYATALKLASKSNLSINRRLLATLTTIMCIYVASWFVPVFIVTALTVTDFSEQTKESISMFVGWGGAINMSCNGWIYLARSRSYRFQFRRLIGYGTESTHHHHHHALNPHGATSNEMETCLRATHSHSDGVVSK